MVEYSLIDYATCLYFGSYTYTMTAPKYKSIMVSIAVYERFHNAYLSRKDKLAAEGIRSLSAFISRMLDDVLLEDEMARRPGRMRKLHVDPGRVVLMDNETGRVAEVGMQDGQPLCHMCKSDSCLHAGFACAIPALF